MDNILPQIPLSIVRYYVVRCRAQLSIPGFPSYHLHAIFGQTPYNQLVLIHLNNIKEDLRPPLREWIQWQEIIPIKNFAITYESLNNHTDHTETEIITLTAEQAIGHGDMDFSDALMDSFEMVCLFLIGAIQPAVNLLDFLIETDLPTVIPLREMLHRILPDDLKTNILGESQLLAEFSFPDEFIPMSLIWFLGKTNMAGIDHYLQTQINNAGDDDPHDYRSEWMESDYFKPSPGVSFPHNDYAHTSLSEAEKKLKNRFEDELKQFYVHADYFFTRLNDPQRSFNGAEHLSPGTHLILTSEKIGDINEILVSVQTKDRETIGYLKKELADILLENMQKGYHYSALIASILPDNIDTDYRVHLLIRRLEFQLN